MLRQGAICTPSNESRRAFVTIYFMNFQRIRPLVPLLLFILISPLLFNIHAHGIMGTSKTTTETSIAAPLGVAPDIDARLAKFRPVEMPFNRSGLSERE